MSEDDSNDGIIGCLPTIVDPLHVQELQSLAENLPNLIVSVDYSQIELAFLRYCRILGLYREQPNLLDEIIPKLIEIFVGYVKLLTNKDIQIDDLSRESLKYMSELFIVRGKKTIVRLLPHQVTLLEPLLVTLEHYSAYAVADHPQRNVLLLWLWIVVRNPFDLKRFDPTGDPNNVITRIMNIALKYMKWNWNTSQYSASLVIAQCLSRSDGIPRLPIYLKNLLDDISTHKDNLKLLLADLLLLLAILKHVDRSVLVNHVQQIYENVSFLYPIDEKNGSLICKCLVKVVQRIGIIALKPKNCQWSYRRGKRLLDDMLNEEDEKMEVDNMEENNWNEEEMEYPEIVEWSLMHVLSSLSNVDTSLRWSAAKGIGRITTRLPNAEFATQVVDSIISEHFGEDAQYSSWHFHGACLALAELARRGTLLPDLLEQVIPSIEKAIEYEDMLGRPQMGNQVRDAACYAIWAFSRTYEPGIMAPYLQKLANVLMCCALFDREVNLRRAASAAFQEMVGRQKGVAYGIDLLTMVDYFAVTNRHKCFSEICVQVASFEEYTPSIMDHLQRKKIVHWDEKIREQSAMAIEKICEIRKIDEKVFIDLLEEMMEEAVKQQTTPTVRHGLILTIGHLVKGLSNRETKIEENILSKIINIPILLKPQTDRMSHTGALMRKATCKFMSNIAESKNIEFEQKMKDEWIERLIFFLKDLSENIKNLAKKAAEAFSRNFLTNEPEKVEKIMNICMKTLQNCNDENERIGMCMMLESLPTSFISENVFETLCNTILRSNKADSLWAVARKHAILAINKFGVNSTKEEFSKVSTKCFETLYKAMMDYSRNSKGDIGRFVRESSMCAMTDILLRGNLENELINEHVIKCSKLMIQQSAERIGRTRECACKCLKQLIESEKIGMKIKHVEKLRRIYDNSHDFIQDNTIFRLKELLVPGDVYYENLILGIIVSAGGLGEGTQKTAKQMLLEHQRAINSQKEMFDEYLRTILKKLKQSSKNARIFNSFMQVLAQIFGNLGIYEMEPEKSENIIGMIEIMKDVALKSTIIQRQRLGVEAISELLNCGTDSGVYRMARSMILEILCSPTPVLRQLAAEKLYEHLCCAEEIDATVLELLSSTNWQEEGDGEELKQIVDKISNQLD